MGEMKSSRGRGLKGRRAEPMTLPEKSLHEALGEGVRGGGRRLCYIAWELEARLEAPEE
jgi:hypothetical protein